jgi:hypothetical protein
MSFLATLQMALEIIARFTGSPLTVVIPSSSQAGWESK